MRNKCLGRSITLVTQQMSRSSKRTGRVGVVQREINILGASTNYTATKPSFLSCRTVVLSDVPIITLVRYET